MEISLGDWLFDVNVPLNMEISAEQAKDHCMCGYCRNYYAAVDEAYPSLRPFLSRFGLYIEGPDELSPFEPTIYEASYIVNGSILFEGSSEIRIDNIPVSVLTSEAADMDTERPEPYFVLTVGLMELPWLLDEDPKEVISPANEEQYLQRMQQKILKRLQNSDLIS